MQISTLYFLNKLYDLTLSLKEKGEGSYLSIYNEIIHKTSKDILCDIPEDISVNAKKLYNAFTYKEADAFLSLLEPFKEKCLSLLPDLSEANEQFHSLVADIFCDREYIFITGAFRKVLKKHFYYIDAELSAYFVTDSFGRVLNITVSPIVRIAVAKYKKDKDNNIFVAGFDKNEVTFSSIKRCNDSFFKTLRHLKTFTFNADKEVSITSSQIAELAESAGVASAVCENKKIPTYYKKLCKNDFPFAKAVSLAFWQALFLFVLLTLLFGIGTGLGAYFAVGFTNIFALFSIPLFYLATAAFSIIYALIVFKKIRSGRF